jgi:hypothetical protein
MFCVKTLKGNVIWYLDVHSDGPDRQPFRQRKFQEMLGTKYCLEKIYSTEERALKLFMQINKKNLPNNTKTSLVQNKRKQYIVIIYK